MVASMPAARRSFTAESTERRIEEGGYSQAVNGLLLDKQLGGLEFANCITSSRLAILRQGLVTSWKAVKTSSQSTAHNSESYDACQYEYSLPLIRAAMTMRAACRVRCGLILVRNRNV